MSYFMTFERLEGFLYGFGTATLIWLAAVLMFLPDACHADYRPTTYLCTSVRYSLVVGKKRCGLRKARVLKDEVVEYLYRDSPKITRRRIKNSFTCKKVEGL